MTYVWRNGFAVLVLIGLLAVSAQSQQTTAASGATSPEIPKARTAGNLEVLSDTKGVDFNPYLSKLLQQVRKNWYNFIPEEARPPQLAAGKTSIEFAILPSGQFAGMKIVHQSGMVSMDRAAWGGIIASNPFDPLPHQFPGEFLALRMHFFYNPKKLPPNEQPISRSTNIPVEKPEAH
jgi:outer membrane biosynthesis protein TonB